MLIYGKTLAGVMVYSPSSLAKALVV